MFPILFPVFRGSGCEKLKNSHKVTHYQCFGNFFMLRYCLSSLFLFTILKAADNIIFVKLHNICGSACVKKLIFQGVLVLFLSMPLPSNWVRGIIIKGLTAVELFLIIHIAISPSITNYNFKHVLCFVTPGTLTSNNTRFGTLLPIFNTQLDLWRCLIFYSFWML